eukprot:3372610-Rhodomonas_salina.1
MPQISERLSERPRSNGLKKALWDQSCYVRYQTLLCWVPNAAMVLATFGCVDALCCEIKDTHQRSWHRLC